MADVRGTSPATPRGTGSALSVGIGRGSLPVPVSGEPCPGRGKGGEPLDPVVQRVGYVDLTGAGHRHPPGMVEFSGQVARASEACKEAAVRREDGDPAV